MLNKLNNVNLVFKQNLLQLKRNIERQGYTFDDNESQLYIHTNTDITATLTFVKDDYIIRVDCNSMIENLHITKEDDSGKILFDKNFCVNSMKNFFNNILL